MRQVKVGVSLYQRHVSQHLSTQVPKSKQCQLWGGSKPLGQRVQYHTHCSPCHRFFCVAAQPRSWTWTGWSMPSCLSFDFLARSRSAWRVWMPKQKRWVALIGNDSAINQLLHTFAEKSGVYESSDVFHQFICHYRVILLRVMNEGRWTTGFDILICRSFLCVWVSNKVSLVLWSTSRQTGAVPLARLRQNEVSELSGNRW